MRLPLDPSSSLPLYRQVAEALRAAMQSGRLAPDEELPSSRDLGAELRVNYHTVGRAYQELEEAGLLIRQRGGPFRVAPGVAKPAAEQVIREGLAALAREALAQGLSPTELRGWWAQALQEASALLEQGREER